MPCTLASRIVGRVEQSRTHPVERTSSCAVLRLHSEAIPVHNRTSHDSIERFGSNGVQSTALGGTVPTHSPSARRTREPVVGLRCCNQPWRGCGMDQQRDQQTTMRSTTRSWRVHSIIIIIIIIIYDYFTKSCCCSCLLREHLAGNASFRCGSGSANSHCELTVQHHEQHQPTTPTNTTNQ
jgi:hypothetical protein